MSKWLQTSFPGLFGYEPAAKQQAPAPQKPTGNVNIGLAEMQRLRRDLNFVGVRADRRLF